MTPNRRRLGFSLLDLMVVIAVIAILIFLLMPSTNAVREAARRTQCNNNLRQLGIACLNYESVYISFPLGSTLSQGVDGLVTSAHARLLPFIEQEALFRALNFNVPPSSPANATIRAITVKTFLCPSDEAAANHAGANSYLFNAGTTAVRAGTPAGVPNGVVFQNSAIKITNIVDGTSNTIMAGESLIGVAGQATVQRAYAATKLANASNLPLDGGQADFSAGRNLAYDRCASWMDGTLYRTMALYRLSPNSRLPDYATVDYASGASAMRSLHRAGANVLYCDGSAMFAVDSTDAKVIAAKATRAGGEVVQ